MSKPTVQNQISGYLLEWEPEQLAIKVMRVHVHSDSRITGDVLITSTASEMQKRPILYPQSSLNFSAPRSRTELAKRLAATVNHVDWETIINQCAQIVQEKARYGETATEIWADEEAEAPRLLIDPVVYEGHPNVIFGDKGVNKSTLATTLAICATLPDWDNPLAMTVRSNYLHTLYLDWETDEKTFRWYLGRLKKGLQCPAVGVFYKRMWLPLADEAEAVAQEIERTGAKLLIIDSLGAAAGGESGELKGTQAALQFNATLRKFGLTSIIIAQTAKPQANEPNRKRTIFGSTYFTYYARNIFELARGLDDSNSSTLHLGLFHRECNFAAKHDPIGFKMTYSNNNSISIEQEELKVSEFIERMSVRVQILQMLKRRPASVAEIIASIKAKQNTIHKNLSRLREGNQITDLEDGRIGLLYNED